MKLRCEESQGSSVNKKIWVDISLAAACTVPPDSLLDAAWGKGWRISGNFKWPNTRRSLTLTINCRHAEHSLNIITDFWSSIVRNAAAMLGEAWQDSPHPNDYFLWRCGPTRAMPSSFTRFLDHTRRRTTVDRTPLDEWSAHRRDFYLTTHNTHKRQTSMPRWDSNPRSLQASGRRPTP